MTYNEKRSLYESIMKDVAKIVKRRLNENAQSETKFDMETLNNPETNMKICQKYPDIFKCKQSPDKSYIGVVLEIQNHENSSDNVKITIFGKTFVNLIERVAVIFLAPMCIHFESYVPKFLYDIKLGQQFSTMWKKVWNNLPEEEQEHIWEHADRLQVHAFLQANSARDVAAKIKTFNMQ